MAISAELIDIRSFYTPASISKENVPLIPRNFFQTYKTSLFDRQHAEWMRVYRSKHPEFDFHFHGDEEMDDFMLTHWGNHPIYPIYKGTQFGPSKADIWRYCILYKYGGIYLDIDSALLFNLNSIPEDVEEMISFEENELKNFSWNEGWPSADLFMNRTLPSDKIFTPQNIALQWFLAFRPEHPILKGVIDLIVEQAHFYANRKFENVLHAVVSFTGPIVYTQAVWQYVLDGGNVSQFGYDVNGLAVFKNIPNQEESVYLNEPNHYELQKSQFVLLLNT
jgi:mannosyltransferase OCH1-like enzyme